MGRWGDKIRAGRGALLGTSLGPGWSALEEPEKSRASFLSEWGNGQPLVTELRLVTGGFGPGSSAHCQHP